VSASLETYLVKLYLDADARRAFTADPRRAAAEAGLDAGDVDEVERIDRVGLELTARSLAAKRARTARRPWRLRWREWWWRIRG
jgi:hypothetical protein